MILTGFLNTDLLYQKPTSSQRERVDKIIREFGLEALGRKQIQRTSAGELRKLLIARALVNAPRVLILDEFCDGLDTRSRLKLLETVEQVAGAGTQILYTTHRPEEILPAISHAAVLGKGELSDKVPRMKLCERTDLLSTPCGSASFAEQSPFHFGSTRVRPLRCRCGVAGIAGGPFQRAIERNEANVSSFGYGTRCF
jgi:ABC-type multidrug transport system ATPase subunit